MLPHIKTHLFVFLLVVAWDTTGVAASRFYAGQSLMALPFSAILTGFWLLGVKLSADKRTWPTAIAAAVVGTWLGIRVI